AGPGAACPESGQPVGSGLVPGRMRHTACNGPGQGIRISRSGIPASTIRANRCSPIFPPVLVAPVTTGEYYAMRTFTLGPATDRKLVTIEVNGPRIRVIQKKPDGTTKRNEKELRSEAEARAHCEQVVRELISRGYVEQTSSGATKARPAPAASKPAASKPAARARGPEVVEEPAVQAGPALPRLGAAPAPATAAG